LPINFVFAFTTPVNDKGLPKFRTSWQNETFNRRFPVAI